MSLRFAPHCCLAIVSCLGLAAQETTRQAQNPNRVQINIQVTDKSGQPVSDLQQADFSILDNKQPQLITSFRAIMRNSPRSPLETVFVLDEINTIYRTVALERDELKKFLQRDAGRLAHPTSLAFATDKGITMGEQVTQDGNILAQEMAQRANGLRSIGRTTGVYRAVERLDLSLHAIQSIAAFESQRPGRKLVIWISPGWAYLSGPSRQLSSKDEASIFHSIVTLSSVLRQTDITLYAVDPIGVGDAATFRTSYYESFLKPVTKQNQALLGDLALQVLSIQSGGLVLNSSNDLAGEFAQCVADAGTYYEVGFNAPPASTPDEFHQLQIKVDRPGLKVRSRNGYYAQP